MEARASQVLSEFGDEEYFSMSGGDSDSDEDGNGDAELNGPPHHPVPAMQDAFLESIVESVELDDEASKADVDAEARRRRLLTVGHYDDSWSARWMQPAGTRHHPLLKLMSQIVFGMHLLQQQQAKSDEEVVKILQTHVDEVDNFLQRTVEDFNLAIKDIEERIEHLKLPMSHMKLFDNMLEDKRFRTQLLDGNDNIEKIIDRTAKAMNAALQDIQLGLNATEELGQYLKVVRAQWPNQNKELAKVYSAMCANEEGWVRCLKGLKSKGIILDKHLVELGTLMGVMSQLAASASRRNTHLAAKTPSLSMSPPSKTESTSPLLQSKFSIDVQQTPRSAPSLNKPLPKAPAGTSNDTPRRIHSSDTPRRTQSKAHPVPFEQRYEQPRQQPPPPSASKSKPKRTWTRPKTSSGWTSTKTPRQNNNNKRTTREMAEVLRQSGPLRSNPPGDFTTRSGSERTSTLRVRASSHGALDALRTAHAERPPPSIARSVSLATPHHQHAAQRPRSPASGRPSDATTNGDESEKTLCEEQAPPPPPASSERANVVTGSEFARHLSIRRKRLPAPLDTTATTTTTAPLTDEPPPTDSAYASAAEVKSPPRQALSPVSEQPGGGRSVQSNVTASSSPAANATTSSPLYESAVASVRSASPGNAPNYTTDPSSPGYLQALTDPDTQTPRGEAQKQKQAQSQMQAQAQAQAQQARPSMSLKTRTLSIRKLFHRKGKGEAVLTSP